MCWRTSVFDLVADTAEADAAMSAIMCFLCGTDVGGSFLSDVLFRCCQTLRRQTLRCVGLASIFMAGADVGAVLSAYVNFANLLLLAIQTSRTMRLRWECVLFGLLIVLMVQLCWYAFQFVLVHTISLIKLVHFHVIC